MSKISRLENGKGIPKMPDVLALLQLYGVTDRSERLWFEQLVRDAREPGWWEPYTDGVSPERHVLEAPGRYPALESEAVALRSVSSNVLHGLLQTPDYARHVLVENLPHHEADEISRLVELRARRQLALRRAVAPLRLTALVDEALLHRAVGGPKVMLGQLDALLEIGSLPDVTIRVLSFASGYLRALRGQFTILELPAPLDDVVYSEGHPGDAYLDSSVDVDLFETLFGDALASALDPDASTALIEACRLTHAPRGNP
jgi:hypothetical protein